MRPERKRDQVSSAKYLLLLGPSFWPALCPARLGKDGAAGGTQRPPRVEWNLWECHKGIGHGLSLWGSPLPGAAVGLSRPSLEGGGTQPGFQQTLHLSSYEIISLWR